MPQLDITYFIPQAFWLIIIFCIFFLINYFILIPSVNACVSGRNKKIHRCKSEIKNTDELTEELLSQIDIMSNHQRSVAHSTLHKIRSQNAAAIHQKSIELGQTLRRDIKRMENITNQSIISFSNESDKLASEFEQEVWNSVSKF